MDIMRIFRCGGLLCLIGHVLLLFHGNIASASSVVNSTNILKPPRTWTWSINDPDVINHTSGLLKPLLVSNNVSGESKIMNTSSLIEHVNFSFMCGFFSLQGAKDSFFFGIVSLHPNSIDQWHNMHLVWSANRNKLVKENATLQLSEDGGLVLRDVDGSLVWSTNHTTKPVVITKMNLTEAGNLLLYGRNDTIVWQSFDHPTDTLLHGQTLRVGRKLTSRLSARNLSEGLYSLLASDQIDNDTVLRFFYGTQEYLKGLANGSYIQAENTFGGFLRLRHDGHLTRYGHNGWFHGLSKLIIPCAYPMACGKYGVCSNGHCTCPTNYFEPADEDKPTSGCRAITELSCPSSRGIEYMSNGSLDKWIFQEALNCAISWQVRQMIVNQVAQGLRYLHEQCIHKIAHLDIKPQNILLDENFNAKLSDFGLSKLIDRDQSNVITMMRGTPGYLAPEWLTSIITEKVDVYSFGVVLAEIVCGRKNLDRSQSNESVVLLNELKDKATQDRLSDIINKYCAEIDINEEEAIQMLRLALWCSHGDYTKRPSMSTVLKVLEGALQVDHSLEFDILTSPNDMISEAIVVLDSATLSAEILSGPR